jgi:RHS repeat-associated protein
MRNNYTYQAFGSLESTVSETENSYLFAGEQLDKSLEDYYLRQRYYHFESGRFSRRDSYEGQLLNPLTLNSYLYGNGNPINGIDPSGLNTILVVSAVTALLSILYVAIIPSISNKLTSGRGIRSIRTGKKLPRHPRPAKWVCNRFLADDRTQKRNLA